MADHVGGARGKVRGLIESHGFLPLDSIPGEKGCGPKTWRSWTAVRTKHQQSLWILLLT